MPTLWALYEKHWRRFCGAHLDPQFHGLTHPARLTGTVNSTDAAPIVIVGTGPSLRASLPALRRVREAVHIFTSPRGADALAEAGMVPDLVLIEHQTPLDAHFSARDLSHRRTDSLSRVPLVAADARTPAALLAGIADDRLFVPQPLPTWGLWPATSVALAIAAGARSICLLGVDLGSASHPDPSQAPLLGLLELLAAHAGVPCLDAGEGGAAKKHWSPTPLDLLAGDGRRPLDLLAQPWSSPAVRHARASAAWQRLLPVVEEAASTVSAACAVRDGDGSANTRSKLQSGLEALLEAGASQAARQDLQDGLGISFLPRYWRTPPDLSIGQLLWRPAAMAAHELLHQHHHLGARLRRAA
ncbi:MAG: 6-hydroxymethylpterin diphosphokinase MptE-like protein [Vicinamibacterales bacterium]